MIPRILPLIESHSQIPIGGIGTIPVMANTLMSPLSAYIFFTLIIIAVMWFVILRGEWGVGKKSDSVTGCVQSKPHMDLQVPQLPRSPVHKFHRQNLIGRTWLPKELLHVSRNTRDFSELLFFISQLLQKTT